MSDFTQYTTLAQVKAYGVIEDTDTDDDIILAQAILAVQNAIDAYCNWSFHAETRTNEERSAPDVKIDSDGYLQIRVDKCPVSAVSSVQYRFHPSQSWASVEASLVEIFPTPSSVPYPRANSNLILCYVNLMARRNEPRPRVKLTYTGGFTGATPPAALNWLATRMVWWRYKQRAAAFDKIAMPEIGQVIVPSALPPDLRRDLELWKRVA